MMTRRTGLAAILAGIGSPALSTDAAAPLKIVYHVGDGVDQAARTMGFMRNQLALPTPLRIIVVAVGPGIDFLITGAKDRNGNPFDATVEDLSRQGIGFRICGNTMSARSISPDAILPEARIVISGMNEIARLGQREGYAYIRP